MQTYQPPSSAGISNKKPFSPQGNKFYGVATGFFSLKTVQDQESVIKSLRAFRNFKKVSKSPDPVTQNYDEYGSGQEEEQEKEDKTQQLMIEFNPLNYIDPEEERNKTAMYNLGIDGQQFYKTIHVQDFYNIKESKQMQMRRYFTKVSEIQQKIKAIMLERQRIEGQKVQKQREKQILAANVLRISKSPTSKGYGSDGDDKYSQKLKQQQKILQKETQVYVRQFIQKEDKSQKFYNNYLKKLQKSEEQHQKDIEAKIQTTRNRIAYHTQRVNIFRSQEREQQQERIQENEKFKRDQIEFIEKNEKIQKQREKDRYEKDQEFFKQRNNFQQNKNYKDDEEFIKSQKLFNKIQKDIDQKTKNHNEIIEQKLSQMQQKDNDLEYYRNIQKQHEYQHRSEMVNYTCNKLEQQQQHLEKLKEDKNKQLQQKIKNKNKKMLTSKENFYQINEQKKISLKETDKNLRQRIYTSDVIKKDYQEYMTHNIRGKYENKLYKVQSNRMEELQQLERKKDQILLKEMQRKIVLDKEANEFTSYIKKKLKLKLMQKKEINEINVAVQDKNPQSNEILKKYDFQDQNKNNISRSTKKDATQIYRENDLEIDQSQSHN